MLATTKKDFERYFREFELPEIIKQEQTWQETLRPHADIPLRREWWNNLIDSLVKDRQLPARAIDWCAPW